MLPNLIRNELLPSANYPTIERDEERIEGGGKHSSWGGRGSNSLRSDVALDALEQAVHARPDLGKLIHHDCSN